MSVLGDIKKSFRFAIDLNGVQQMAVQKITGLETELEAVAHGEDDRDVFTPGRVKYGKITLEMVQSIFGSDTEMWRWLETARRAGVAGMRTFTIRQLGVDGVTTIAAWQIEQVFPTKVSQGEMSRMSSDNIMQSVELSPPSNIIRLI